MTRILVQISEYLNIRFHLVPSYHDLSELTPSTTHHIGRSVSSFFGPWNVFYTFHRLFFCYVFQVNLKFPLPDDIDKSLHETDVDKIRDHRTDYNNRPSNSISFISTGGSTSDLLHMMWGCTNFIFSDSSGNRPFSLYFRSGACTNKPGNVPIPTLWFLLQLKSKVDYILQDTLFTSMTILYLHVNTLTL